MTLKSPLIALICLSIMAAAWLAAVSGDRAAMALATAAIISLVCAGVVVLRFPNAAHREDEAEQPAEKKEPDEAAKFRRAMFDLCAALKLGIRFCEQHLGSEPDELIDELERMRDHISAFVNDIARPVRFYSRRRWPWPLAPRRRSQQ